VVGWLGWPTRNPENARAFAAKHGVPFATTSVEELVARPDLQVVCITTPSGAHLEPALAAREGGKHVVIEKPIEITTERADALLREAEKAGVQVAPISQARFGAGAAAEGGAGRGTLWPPRAWQRLRKWHRPDSYYTGWKGTLALDGGGALMNQAIRRDRSAPVVRGHAFRGVLLENAAGLRADRSRGHRRGVAAVS
jgi:predicted dehydrogenase